MIGADPGVFVDKGDGLGRQGWWASVVLVDNGDVVGTSSRALTAFLDEEASVSRGQGVQNGALVAVD